MSPTGIRINLHGAESEIPFVKFRLGDIVLKDGKEFRITTRRMKLRDLFEHGRFRFSPVSETWHRVVFHGSVPLYYYSVAVLFGEGDPGGLLMPEPHVVVDALDLEEVVDEF